MAIFLFCKFILIQRRTYCEIKTDDFRIHYDIGSTAVSLYGNDDHSETETIFFEETLPVEDKNIDSFIQISDNYPDEDSRAELFGEEKIIERLIAFNKNLNCNWDYYEITTQALQSKEFYSGDERFVNI